MAAAAASLLVASSLAVTNQYYADLIRNGPALRWTDAADSLKQYLLDAHPDRIFIADWGITETLNLLSSGTMPIYQTDGADQSTRARMVAVPNALFVSHTRPIEYRPQLRAFLDEAASEAGEQEKVVMTISDLNGRPTFEIFRFTRATD